MRIHLEGQTGAVVEYHTEVALVSVEMGLEAADRRHGLPEVKHCIGHSVSGESYSSEGGKVFLKVVWLMSAVSREGYIESI